MHSGSSEDLFTRAAKVIPGGVNSPVRAFKGVEGTPRFISSGKGARVTDVDGKEYIDYVGSWGPLIFGHASNLISDAITSRLESGVSFGAPTELEVVFAELVTSIVPGVEMVRMVNSGTEATMTAVRLARGYTGRDFIIKCNGCYHGHADTMLVQAGSGVATLGIAGSPGVPSAIAELCLSVEYNDIEQIEAALEKVGAENVAAIILEPVPGNMGLVLPNPGYLQALRSLCDRHGIVLIFDEVMSGFRVSLGGASERFDVTADLVTLGKVIGGGLPVGAFGGKREIMERLAPVGPVYQAGTLSGNPLAMAAGFAAVSELVKLNPYQQLEALGSKLVDGMCALAKEHSIPLVGQSCGSMIGIFFSDSPVTNFTEAKASDVDRFRKFFHAMLDRGVYLAPSAFEAGFLSTAHTETDIDQTLSAVKEAFSSL